LPGMRWMNLALSLTLAGAVVAEEMPDLPKIRGLWTPVLGRGAVYQVTTPEETVDLQTAVVGEEAGGVWLEEMVSGAKGELVVKALIGHEGIQTLIVQPPGKGPLLLPPGGAPGMPDPPSGGTEDDVSRQGGGELVGKEVITTPAGTYNTVHYKIDEHTHVWVTPDIPPLGVVQLTSEQTKITLKKLLTGAQTRVTGEPKKLLPLP